MNSLAANPVLVAYRLQGHRFPQLFDDTAPRHSELSEMFPFTQQNLFTRHFPATYAAGDGLLQAFS